MPKDYRLSVTFHEDTVLRSEAGKVSPLTLQVVDRFNSTEMNVSNDSKVD